MRIVVRIRAARTRLARFVSGSAVVHGLLLTAILVVPWTRRSVVPIENATVVALAGPIGGSPAPARAAAAPPAAAPAPAPPPKEAHTVKEVPVPKPKDKAEIKKKEPPKPEPKKPAPPDAAPGPETQGPKTSESHAPAGAPSHGTAPGPGTATGVTASIGGGDAALGWYGAAVKAALESAWQKPYLEEQGQVFSVVVAFDIARDGASRNVRIVAPSGIPSLDRSAVRAIVEASPFPAVPPAWTEEILPVTMRFDFNPETSGP